LANKVTMRIGLQSVREIELEVDDADDVIAALTAAMTAEDPLAWVTDTKHTRHGIAVDKLAFVQVDAAEPKMVGFG